MVKMAMKVRTHQYCISKNITYFYVCLWYAGGLASELSETLGK